MKKALSLALGAIFATSAAFAQTTVSASHAYEFDNGGSGAYYDTSQTWIQSALSSTGAGNFSYIGEDYSLAGLGLSGTASGLSLNLPLKAASQELPVDIYLASASYDVVANGANIMADNPPVAGENSDGIDMNFAPILAGTYVFNGSDAAGTVEKVNLNLSNAGVQSYLSNAIATGGTIRVIVAANLGALATSQYANDNGNYDRINGLTSTPLPSITLTTQAAPEPMSIVALGMGAAALIRRRRS